MYKVLIADKLNDKGLELLQKDPLIEVVVKLKMPVPTLLETICDYDAILVRSETKITSEVIQNGKKLKVIGRAGIGLDNIDLEAAAFAGIKVLSVNDASTISVAEHTLGMILALARHIPQAHKSTSEKLWEREKYMGVEIFQKVIGIIGLGKIGFEVALRAKAMGMQIIAYDPYCTSERADQVSALLVPLHQLLANSDFITLHIPRNDETIDLISYNELSLCKRGVRIINISRGGILNEEALIHALNDGLVAGAALDVFENEPYINEELLELHQVITTPHIAASTEDAQTKIGVMLALNVINVLHEIESHLSRHDKSEHSHLLNEKRSLENYL